MVIFLTSSLSFQASQQIKPCEGNSLSVSTIKHFLSRMGEKYTLQKMSNTSSDPGSQDVTVNEAMEPITMMDDKQTDTAESAHKAANEEDLLSFFNQPSDLMSSSSDLLSKDIDAVIN